MHELWLCNRILEIIQEQASNQQFPLSTTGIASRFECGAQAELVLAPEGENRDSPPLDSPIAISQREPLASIQTYARVKVINLEIGELAAVEKSALLFSFEVAAKGTIAENALLKFIIIPGEAWCERCEKAIRVKHLFQACEFCNNDFLSIISGEEFRVHSMEVE